MPRLTFEELISSRMTFHEIAAEYGEETAINVGIARDPDTFELDDEWFARARPASEVHPELVERWLRSQGKQKLSAKVIVSIRLDADVLDHYRSAGEEWQSRINEILRQAAFGSQDSPTGN